MTAEGRKFGEDQVLYGREIEATEWMEIEREQIDAHVKATNQPLWDTSVLIRR